MPGEIKEVKDDLTEEDIKSFEEAEEEEEQEEEEKEEAPEESEEADDAEEEELEDKSTGEKNTSAPEIKEVAGETPREKALRLEVTRLRRANRLKDQKAIMNVTPKEEEEDESYEDLKALGYTDEQIEGLKQVVDVIASKKGYVKKATTYKEMADQTLNGFIESHPEYAPENDKDDLYWGRFKEVLADYNLNGKNSQQLTSIFNRVDREVKEELGDKPEPKKIIDAKKRKVEDASHSTSVSSKAPEKQDVKPKTVHSAGSKTFVSSNHPNLVFKGFDDDEIEEILN